MKGRIGEKMIEEAEAKGALRPGGTIIEPTSGNTGLGLAMIAAIKGYRTVFTMPDKMSREKIDLLKALGARVVVTPTAVPPDHPESYYRVAERIHRETPNSILPNRHANQANPQAHAETTGPEIWPDTDGKITHFVGGMARAGPSAARGSSAKKRTSASSCRPDTTATYKPANVQIAYIRLSWRWRSHVAVQPNDKFGPPALGRTRLCEEDESLPKQDKGDDSRAQTMRAQRLESHCSPVLP